MANTTVAGSDVFAVGASMLATYGTLFYAVDPRSTRFTAVSQVPAYIVNAYPFFILHMVAEAIYLLLSSSKTANTRQLRVNDAITSISAGMFQQIVTAFTKGWTMAIYVFVWENFSLIPMDSGSIWTWVFAMLGVDFGYYWFHRMAHEVNVFWAAHVVHHSSEDYNQTTALRQSIAQQYFSWMFYLPLALFIPPPMFVTHMAFNTLFQFWIHTSTVPTLGILEKIINTPSSHRVHHGRNPYCIDKNYAGTFIIWDILFGTYEAEHPDEPVLYGLTHGLGSFDLVWVQMHHFVYLAGRVRDVWGLGFGHVVRVLMYGPGWTPEKPTLRLGDNDDIPRVPNLVRDPKADIRLFNPRIALAGSAGSLSYILMSTYLVVHFALTIVAQFRLPSLMETHAHMSSEPIILASTILFSLWVLSLFLEQQRARLAVLMEFLRLFVVVPVCAMVVGAFSATVVGAMSGASLLTLGAIAALARMETVTSKKEK